MRPSYENSTQNINSEPLGEVEYNIIEDLFSLESQMEKITLLESSILPQKKAVMGVLVMPPDFKTTNDKIRFMNIEKKHTPTKKLVKTTNPQCKYKIMPNKYPYLPKKLNPIMGKF